MKTLKIFFGLFVLAGSIWWLSQDVSAQPRAPDVKPKHWEYITEQVDANALQAKLTEWSQADWELVSVTTAFSTVEPGDKPSLRLEKVLLVAKRLRP